MPLMTMAQALLRYLAAQSTEIDGKTLPLFAGIFAIFGHGNVAGIGQALAELGDKLPTFRAHNEQAMALSAVAFAKASNRRRMMACTSSIGPGATNMVTAAAVAHVNRLPLLLLPGDVFAGRRPDPVLQQIENFADPTLSANDCFRPVSRYWDRITRPEQLLTSLPQALARADRSRRLRPRGAGLAAGCPGRGGGFPGELLRAAPPSPAPPGARCRRACRGAAHPVIRQGPASALRRRRALQRGRRRACRLRRAPWHTGGGDPGRQGRARPGPIA